LEFLIGPFRSSPLGLVLKAGSPGQFHVIQILPFPQDSSIPSINNFISSAEFPCEWGAFYGVVLQVMDTTRYCSVSIKGSAILVGDMNRSKLLQIK